MSDPIMEYISCLKTEASELYILEEEIKFVSLKGEHWYKTIIKGVQVLGESKTSGEAVFEEEKKSIEKK